MSPPPRALAPDARLRHEVAALLLGRQAHVDAATALADVPPDRVHDRPAGWAHSLYDLVWHLRSTQADILAFSTDPDYVEPAWPDGYWPEVPGDDWDVQRTAFLDDLDALVGLAETADLFAELPWAPGYTILRELLLAADHTSHHLGQVVALRRALGIW